MLDHREYSYSAEAAETNSSTTSSRKKKSKNKKRFSDEQIKSLESIFETDTKLEPRKKLQLARELGLQPRQVAIWFQNKRARWKSKQLERDYSILRANYTNLASRFEALKKEKQALIVQLQKLNDQKQKPKEQVKAANSMDSESDNGDIIKHEAEVKPSPSMERSEHVLSVLSDDDSSINAEYFGLENEPSLLGFVDHGDGSLTSPEDWGTLDSDDLLDQSGNGYQWWDFWS